jgi:hypothetical protein
MYNLSGGQSVWSSVDTEDCSGPAMDLALTTSKGVTANKGNHALINCGPNYDQRLQRHCTVLRTTDLVQLRVIASPAVCVSPQDRIPPIVQAV